MAQYEAGVATLTAARAEAKRQFDAQQTYVDTLPPAEREVAQALLDKEKAEAETRFAQTEANLAQLKAKLDEGARELVAGRAQIAERKRQIEEGAADIESGEAQLAGELYTLHKGMSFILPPQTLHSFRRLGSEYLKVLWFHAAP